MFAYCSKTKYRIASKIMYQDTPSLGKPGVDYPDVLPLNLTSLSGHVKHKPSTVHIIWAITKSSLWWGDLGRRYSRVCVQRGCQPHPTGEQTLALDQTSLLCPMACVRYWQMKLQIEIPDIKLWSHRISLSKAEPVHMGFPWLPFRKWYSVYFSLFLPFLFHL